MWINCEEFIPAKNIEIHSRYCRKPKTRKGTEKDFLEEEMDFDEFINPIEGQADTIPRVNQRLYKIMKALKHKEIECGGRTNITGNYQQVSLYS